MKVLTLLLLEYGFGGDCKQSREVVHGLNPSSTGIRFRGPSPVGPGGGKTLVLTLLLLEYGFGGSKKRHLDTICVVLTLLLLEYGFGVNNQIWVSRRQWGS